LYSVISDPGGVASRATLRGASLDGCGVAKWGQSGADQ
jgi:hypothetical protein